MANAPLINLKIPEGETGQNQSGTPVDRETTIHDEEPSYRLRRAINLLISALANGPQPVSELRALGARSRLGRGDLKLARHELGVRSYAGEDGKQLWEINNDIYR